MENIDSPYTIRIIQHYEKKMRCTIIDAEIAGCRTMVSNRVNAKIDSVKALAEKGAMISSFSAYAVDEKQVI